MINPIDITTIFMSCGCVYWYRGHEIEYAKGRRCEHHPLAFCSSVAMYYVDNIHD